MLALGFGCLVRSDLTWVVGLVDVFERLLVQVQVQVQ